MTLHLAQVFDDKYKSGFMSYGSENTNRFRLVKGLPFNLFSCSKTMKNIANVDTFGIVSVRYN
jgi:hypothetical protein